MPTLKIHPSFGVARIGNSDQFFIGPENPGIPGNWDSAAGKFKPFRDAQGKILRQAARFRIFQFDDAGNSIKELTLADGVKLEWRVHVANLKASFFTFNGLSGEETNPPYVGRASRPANSVEKQDRGRGQPGRLNRRNATVSDRRSLEIDPGVVALQAPGEADLVDSQTKAPIQRLGKIQMQTDGALLFLGGQGQTLPNAPAVAPIDEYANNDGWFDDMCDGSVQATVTFPDGHVEEAEQAWVIVGPPKFAPGIRNVVSLYDTLWDLAVRFGLPCQPGNDAVLQDLAAQQRSWQAQTNELAADYQPSFLNHIYPLLSRALAARDVHAPPSGHPEYHATVMAWQQLAQRSEDQIRQTVFNRIRNPNSNVLDPLNMPRGLGDNYTTLDDFETDPTNPPPAPNAFLSVTRVQYALLKAWSEGRFKEDWTFGDVKYTPIPAPGPVTPHGLDCAALENCVGGPFYPGIEVSWLVRTPALYTAAFRLKKAGFDIGPLRLDGGFFSQQMALPWQADFYDCHKEDHTPDGADEPLVYMWWTAQRPDDIRAAADGPYRRWVEPFDAAKDVDDPDNVANLARFEQMRTRWFELSFLTMDGDEFIEQT